MVVSTLQDGWENADLKRTEVGCSLRTGPVHQNLIRRLPRDRQQARSLCRQETESLPYNLSLPCILSLACILSLPCAEVGAEEAYRCRLASLTAEREDTERMGDHSQGKTIDGH